MTTGIRKLFQWGLTLVAAILALQTLVVFRSAEHLGRARDHVAAGRILQGAREYQTAIGYYAPFNPFSDTAGVELQALTESTADTDPALAADLADRLRRSVRGTRSFYQPHGELIR